MPRRLAVLLATLCGFAPLLHAQALSRPSLISALQRGGYVIVMRHASSPAARPTKDTAAPGNSTLERQLDATGRTTATAMGKAFRDLKIPLGQVLISPTFRVRQTAELAGWTTADAHPELGDNGEGMQQIVPEVQTQWLQARVGEKPREGTNTLVVTQSTNIAAAFPSASTDLAEGESIVFRPGATSLTTVVVARVKIEEWPRLAATRSAVDTTGQREAQAAPAPPSTFAARIAQLSERGGSFDTDNLLSNEKSYLHVFPALKERGVTGGAYIGVGPDQNFSYIAQLKPTVAIIVDIRRDNLLEHLLFKALFQLAPTRVEYLSLLFGRAPPAAPDDFKRADIDRLARYIDNGKADPAAISRLRARVDATIRAFGVPLTNADFSTIDRFHRTFIDAGLSLKYEFQGRQSPAGYYPSYRELLFETGRDGKHWNFLASEADFQFVRSLEGRDLVIPVVGDLGGQTALRNIARYLTGRGTRVNVFYVSNVESYLSTDGKMQDFLDNLARLPRDRQSALIRSVFGGYVLPQTVRGYHSTSLVQPIDDLLDGFANGKYKSYNDLLLSR